MPALERGKDSRSRKRRGVKEILIQFVARTRSRRGNLSRPTLSSAPTLSHPTSKHSSLPSLHRRPLLGLLHPSLHHTTSLFQLQRHPLSTSTVPISPTSSPSEVHPTKHPKPQNFRTTATSVFVCVFFFFKLTGCGAGDKRTTPL